MTVTDESFRNTLGTFPSGVTIVTARSPEGVDFGMTISSFSSVSLSPPQILFCLSQWSHTLPFFDTGFYFAVNVLNHNQKDLCSQFAKGVPTDWSTIPHSRHEQSQCLLIADAISHVVCKQANRIAAGDHNIIVGEVCDLVRSTENQEPLVRHNRGFYRLAPDA